MRGNVYGVMALGVVWLALPVFGQVGATGTTNVEKPKIPQVVRLPYTAEYKLTTVKTLADGSTITHESTEVNARDSQGRRMTAETVISEINGQTMEIRFSVSDPVANTNTVWSSQGHLATVSSRLNNPVKPAAAHHPSVTIAPASEVAPASTPSKASIPPEKTAFEDPAIKAHREISEIRARMLADLQSKPPEAVIEFQSKPSVAVVKREPPVEEELGTAKIQGLDVRGHRTTIKTPIGAVGNSAILLETRERWYAIDPGLNFLTVRMVENDLLNGKRTKELVKFDQSEPDPSVFHPPAGYEIVTVPEEKQEAPRPQPMPPVHLH